MPNERMYYEFADWFHLITAPDEYTEEAVFYIGLAAAALEHPPETLLELGSGGGNNASHYKLQLKATLTDLSPHMLALSRTVNPGLEHIQGDMCSLRLGRQFDIVFAHDAISYMVTEAQLKAAIDTAFAHTRPGGVAVFVPNDTRESFLPQTTSGGRDGDGRSLRYLEWTTDPDLEDTTCTVDYVYIFHEESKPPRIEHDRHILGVFPRETWLRLLQEAGFDARVEPFVHSELPDKPIEVMVAKRPRLASSMRHARSGTASPT